MGIPILRVRDENGNLYAIPAIRGEKGQAGPQGEPGKGFAVLGYYATAGELAAAQISPGAGDAYGVGSAEPYEIYVWDAVNHIWRNNGPLQGAMGEPGQPGADGRSLEFVWDGTRLGIRVQGESTYQYTELKGADGAPGAAGEPGYTPQRGTDYWTAADQAQIVQDVLAALPNASGGSF